jgi:hypothetical protein
MVWRSVAGASVVVLSATLVSTAGAAPRTGRIVGHVRECNTPTTCIIQPFTVLARNRAGVIVARTSTTGNNYFALRLPAGHYALTARSTGGLSCHASATAVANRTAHITITCLVP